MKEDLSLTASQRVIYYERALATYKIKFCGPYTCNVLQDLIKEDLHVIFFGCTSYRFCKINFPEFHSQLGKAYAWSNTKFGNLRREEALNRAIDLVSML